MTTPGQFPTRASAVRFYACLFIGCYGGEILVLWGIAKLRGWC